MALVQHYVDPSLDANIGNGTIGSPWGDLAYAIQQVALSKGTYGDQLNVLSSATEVLTATLPIATYAPAQGVPLVIRGCDAVANDGGIGVVNCNGFPLSAASDGYSGYIDLELYGGGPTTTYIQGFVQCLAYNIYVHGSGNIGINLNTYSDIRNCRIELTNGYGIAGGSAMRIVDNYIVVPSGRYGITSGIGSSYARNIVVCDPGASWGMYFNSSANRVENNSVYCTGAGTGKGIFCDDSRTADSAIGNLVEGFSGAGGVGIEIEFAPGNWQKNVMARNAVYNCTTAYLGEGDVRYAADNEITSVSPFAKSGALTYANRFAYFAPIDTGNVYGGAGKNLDKGAVQHEEVSGGGSGIIILGS